MTTKIDYSNYNDAQSTHGYTGRRGNRFSAKDNRFIFYYIDGGEEETRAIKLKLFNYEIRFSPSARVVKVYT